MRCLSTNVRFLHVACSVVSKKYWSLLCQSVSCMRVYQHRMSSTMAALDEWSAAGRKVLVTGRVPQEGVDMLKSAGCIVTQWNNDSVMPRDELIKGVRGCDALFCLLTNHIDKDVLDAAGLFMAYFIVWRYTAATVQGRQVFFLTLIIRTGPYAYFSRYSYGMGYG